MAGPFPVLIVDDDSSFRRYLLNLLRSLDDIEGIEAEDTYTALCLLKERQDVSLILLDRIMPGIDSIDFVKNIQAKGDAPPVIMIAEREGPADMAMALEVGVYDYLVKPIRTKTLLRKVDLALKHNSGQQQEQSASRTRIHALTTTTMKILDLRAEGCELESTFHVEAGARLFLDISRLAVELESHPEDRFCLEVTSSTSFGDRYKIVGIFVGMPKTFAQKINQYCLYGKWA